MQRFENLAWKNSKKLNFSQKSSHPHYLHILFIKGRNDTLPISQGALSTLHPRFRLYPALRVSQNTLRASFTALPAPRVSQNTLRVSFTAFPAPRVFRDILKAGKPHIPCPRSPPTYYLRHKKPYPSSSDTGHLTRCAIHWTIRRD